MARTIPKPGVKEAPLSEIKDDLSRYLREAETQEIVITRHGKPAGVLIGFESEDDWFDYHLEHASCPSEKGRHGDSPCASRSALYNGAVRRSVRRHERRG